MDNERRIVEQLELLNMNIKKGNELLLAIDGNLGEVLRLMHKQQR